jgi:hypothetical protein
MKLKDIAAISGMPGLFRILKPTRNGMIIETLDAQRRKSMVNATHRVSILKEISMYVTTEEDSVPLEQVMRNIYEHTQGGKVEVGTSGADLTAFMEQALPEYDRERVYDSDIKKLAKWYNLLQEFAPEAFEEEEAEEAETTAEEK